MCNVRHGVQVWHCSRNSCNLLKRVIMLDKGTGIVYVSKYSPEFEQTKTDSLTDRYRNPLQRQEPKHSVVVLVLNVYHKYEVCTTNTRTVWIARLELVSGDPLCVARFEQISLLKRRRYFHLLISYTVLSKECFFVCRIVKWTAWRSNKLHWNFV